MKASQSDVQHCCLSNGFPTSHGRQHVSSAELALPVGKIVHHQIYINSHRVTSMGRRKASR